MVLTEGQSKGKKVRSKVFKKKDLEESDSEQESSEEEDDDDSDEEDDSSDSESSGERIKRRQKAKKKKDLAKKSQNPNTSISISKNNIKNDVISERNIVAGSMNLFSNILKRQEAQSMRVIPSDPQATNTNYIKLHGQQSQSIHIDKSQLNKLMEVSLSDEDSPKKKNNLYSTQGRILVLKSATFLPDQRKKLTKNQIITQGMIEGKKKLKQTQRKCFMFD